MNDVVVVGAGPAGSAAAIAFARQGARVRVLEGAHGPTRRLAGEWVHPGGVAALKRLGISPAAIGTWEQRGFIVHPGDGSAPIELSYPGHAVALSARHQDLCHVLRQQALHTPGVDLTTNTPVLSVTDQFLTYTDRATGRDRGVKAPLAVGADGVTSVVRKSMDCPSSSGVLSRMAGLALADTELDQAHYGHVFLGAPGPVLAYHLGPRTVRLFLDVPLGHPGPAALPAYLWECYGPVLPPSLREPVHQALQRQQVQWAVNRFRPRTHLGHASHALIGDAAGCSHPLAAIGLSMGFLDAESLAQHHDVARYSRERKSTGWVPERLAANLCRAFTSHDDASTCLLSSVYDLWRRNPIERARCMGMLGLYPSSRITLGASALTMFEAVLGDLARETLATRNLTPVPRTVAGLLSWMVWASRTPST